MAAAVSERAPDNAEQLRRRANRRLLGASILLLIAIIAVPMFLEREPPPLPDNVDVRIPPVEGTKFEPKLPDGKKAAAEKPAEIAAITEPVGAQAAAAAMPAPGLSGATSTTATPLTAVAPAPAVAAAPVAPKAAAAPEKTPAVDSKKAAPAKESPKAAEKAPEKAAEKPAAKAAASAEAARKPGQLVIQVIAVRDPATAKQLYDKAKALKFPVYTEKIDVSNGVVTRVRVGPYENKQQAESARAKLAQAGFEAKVVTLQ